MRDENISTLLEPHQLDVILLPRAALAFLCPRKVERAKTQAGAGVSNVVFTLDLYIGRFLFEIGATAFEACGYLFISSRPDTVSSFEAF